MINILFASILTAAFVLLASFRIAGPMYRFNQALGEIIQGKLNAYTKIREKDQLYECSKTLGELSQSLSTSFLSLKTLLGEAEALAAHSVNPELQAKLEEIKTVLERYETG